MDLWTLNCVCVQMGISQYRFQQNNPLCILPSFLTSRIFQILCHLTFKFKQQNLILFHCVMKLKVTCLSKVLLAWWKFIPQLASSQDECLKAYYQFVIQLTLWLKLFSVYDFRYGRPGVVSGSGCQFQGQQANTSWFRWVLSPKDLLSLPAD